MGEVDGFYHARDDGDSESHRRRGDLFPPLLPAKRPAAFQPSGSADEVSAPSPAFHRVPISIPTGRDRPLDDDETTSRRRGGPLRIPKVVFLTARLDHVQECRDELREAGLHVELIPAGSRHELDRALVAGDVDLLVLEEGLPEATSAQVIRGLPEERRPMTILVAAAADETVVAEAELLGVEDFVPAGPDSAPLVARAVEGALRHRAAIAATERKWSRLVSRSSFDGLTHLANRRAFDEALEREIAAANRSGLPLAVVIVSLDDFDRVVAGHGIGFGDRVLLDTGSLLGGLVRTRDLVARHGADEFALLFPETHLADVLEVGERIVRAFAAQPFRTGNDETVHLTASVGLSLAVGPSRRKGGSELIASAEGAMRRSRALGGNRLTVACEPVPPPPAAAHR